MSRILLLISCLLISAMSFADDQPENREAEIIQALTDLSAQLPQQYLSLDAVADHNEYDENRIIKWVADNIQYSPSPGYQLTPENALLTATGNALEQAMLLQNILTQAGFEVRISKADLDEETAIELLKQSFISSPANQWEFSDEVRDQYLEKLGSLDGYEESRVLERYQELVEQTPWNESALYKEAGSLSKTLFSAIENQGAWQMSSESMSTWIEVAKKYYFVKYRLAQGDKWLQAHPAFVQNPPSIENSTYFTDEIASQYHQITMQAFITRQINGKKTETIAVTPLIERTSQQLFDGQLTFVTAPSNVQRVLDEKSLQLVYESKYFVPMVDGELSDETRAFSLDGQDYRAMEVLDSAQALMNTVKDKTTKAGSTLDALSKKPGVMDADIGDEMALTLLDYHVVIGWEAPNGESRKIKRTIYRQHEKYSDKSIVEDITQRILLAAEPGVLSLPAQSSKHLNAQISVLTLLQKAEQQELSEIQALSQVTDWYLTQKDLSFNSTLALSRKHKGVQQYFSSSPMLAMVWERESYEIDQSSGTRSFDYLVNAAQVFKLSDSGLAIDVSATLEHGVWSTYGEALVQGKAQNNEAPLSRQQLPRNVSSAAGQFNQATESGKIIEVVTSAIQLDRVPFLQYALKERLKTELDGNSLALIVLPQRPPSKDFLAYYRVDTRTGETLGYSELGRGTATAEYLKTLRFYIRVYTAMISAAKCGRGATTRGAGTEQNKKILSCLICATVKAGFSIASVTGGSDLTSLGGDFVGASCATHSLME